MTRALVTQMLDCLVKLSKQFDCDIDPFTFGRYGGNSVIKAAREYLATEPSVGRAGLIAGLRGSAARLREDDCGAIADEMMEAADMLEADDAFRPDWVNYRQGVKDGKADAQQAEALTKEREALKAELARPESTVVSLMRAENAALKDAARLALDALENIPTAFGNIAYTKDVQEAIAALKAVL